MKNLLNQLNKKSINTNSFYYYSIGQKIKASQIYTFTNLIFQLDFQNLRDTY